MSILVIGMGNILKGDDGLGVYALRALAEDPPAGAELLELGTSLSDCFSVIEGYDVIVALDAVMAGGTPGSLYRLSRRELVRAGHGGLSLHECELLDALDLAALRGRHPVLHVAGMEPLNVTAWSMELSAPVRENMARYLTMIRNDVREFAERRASSAERACAAEDTRFRGDTCRISVFSLQGRQSR